MPRIWIGGAAAALWLGYAAIPGAVRADDEMLAQGYYQQEQCGKSGYGVALCPSTAPRHVAPSGREAAPNARYQQPTDDCTKTGWGITECPNYGKKESEEAAKAATESAAPNAGYRKPVDDCVKTGWGITECPNYQSTPAGQ
jgi:hypothetical protein